MNPKELKWLSMLAAVLAVVVVVDSLTTTTGPALGQTERLFPELAANSIESFTVTRGATNIVAQRTTGDYPTYSD